MIAGAGMAATGGSVVTGAGSGTRELRTAPGRGVRSRSGARGRCDGRLLDTRAAPKAAGGGVRVSKETSRWPHASQKVKWLAFSLSHLLQITTVEIGHSARSRVNSSRLNRPWKERNGEVCGTTGDGVRPPGTPHGYED
jgi:hypothetical protein